MIVYCPHCEARLTYSKRARGSIVLCHACKKAFPIPSLRDDDEEWWKLIGPPVVGCALLPIIFFILVILAWISRLTGMNIVS